MRHCSALCSAIAALAAVAGCGGSAHKAATTTAASAAPAARTKLPASSATPGLAVLQRGFVEVIRRTTPEVVQISGPSGLGSGVVFDHKGDVVTNAHVVAGRGPFRVTDSSGHSYAATVVGTFVPDDLGVVHAGGTSLRSASFGDSRTLQVGDIVVAIGNPLGLRSSVTNGIVSALGRTVGEPDGAVLPNVIQTSAPINPGNSGGALVDLNGRVVGIPTLAATDPQLGGGAAPGIGFAIPSSVVTDIAGQIVKHGKVTDSHRAFLGVVITGTGSGSAVVASVRSGGPAARAGIRPGDVILAINGQRVSGPSDVANLLAALHPGETVSVTVTKPGHGEATVKVKLGQYPG